MDLARISALLEPFLEAPLSESQLDQISTYIDLLLRWNARFNLTAIRDPEQIVPRHFGESLFLARHLFPLTAAPRPRTTVVDLGSGAGFPALPIKIWAPDIRLTMIESNHKKAAFLREVARALTLMDVDVIAGRAESVAHQLASPGPNPPAATPGTVRPAEVVTFRAVENFAQILPLAARFLAPNARLALLITESQQEQLQPIRSLSWRTIHVPESHTGILAIGTTTT